MVQKFFQNGEVEEGMNLTNICLIPKKLHATSLKEFRPISLCNVVFKVITKILATRMKRVLPCIISDTQAAFVEGRLISDNILVAHELLHALNSRNKCAEEFIAIKTDISKAYDRVEWAFLHKAMRTLGFSERWCRIIMGCVSSVKYQVLINGTPYGEITPSRGLRQGDPLSPYLFVVCTEVLVQMLKTAERKQQITGLKVARGALAVSHLLYADDSLFYCKGNDEELQQVTQIWERYSMVSGQRINYQKSCVYFGKLIPEERREQIKNKLGIHQIGGEGTYLGLPESFGGSKVSILSFLKEKLSQRIQGWQTRFLSPGGKETLLKSIAMALPTYTMSCFLLPKTLMKKIMGIMSDFWWQTKKEGRGLHWKSWDQLTRSKNTGGLGFKDLEAFNLALLGKQLWRMMTHRDSLMARVFKSRYFAKSDPLSASLGSRPSYAWRSIHAAQSLIKQGARVTIGNGKETNLWQEQWLSRKPARHAVCMRREVNASVRGISSDMKVCELMIQGTREWDIQRIQELFPEEESRLIQKVRVMSSESEDNYCWDYTKTGHYTVKSGYWVQQNVIQGDQSEVLVNQPSLDCLYQAIWQVKTSPKIQHFLWKCLSNILPVAETMKKRHIDKEDECHRCSTGSESINHMLFQCPLLDWYGQIPAFQLRLVGSPPTQSILIFIMCSQ